MLIRFILVFVGFLTGATTMSIIYDYKLVLLGIYFTNQAGLYGGPNVIIKTGMVTIFLITCGVFIYFKPKQDE